MPVTQEAAGSSPVTPAIIKFFLQKILKKLIEEAKLPTLPNNRTAKNKKFIEDTIIDSFENHKSDKPVKLIEHLKSLNTAYKNKHYPNCAVIIRGILDYIPPFFGCKTIGQLLSQINGKIKNTFKESLTEIDKAIRNVADDVLHNPASLKEIIKVTKQTIDNQEGNLKIILEKVVRQLINEDLRGKVKELIINKNSSETQKSQLEMFENYIENKEWRKEFIDNKEIWICKEDNLFQIHHLNDYKDFSEPWTQCYPDSLGSGQHSVDLLYNNNFIKRFTFIYCDGGRINVALPQTENNSNKNIWENKDKLGRSYKNINFFYEKKNLDFKLTKLIGSFYIYNNIEGIALISKIEIR